MRRKTCCSVYSSAHNWRLRGIDMVKLQLPYFGDVALRQGSKCKTSKTRPQWLLRRLGRRRPRCGAKTVEVKIPEKTLIIGESYEYTHSVLVELPTYEYIAAPTMTSAFRAHLKDRWLELAQNHVWSRTAILYYPPFVQFFSSLYTRTIFVHT